MHCKVLIKSIDGILSALVIYYTALKIILISTAYSYCFDACISCVKIYLYRIIFDFSPVKTFDIFDVLQFHIQQNIKSIFINYRKGLSVGSFINYVTQTSFFFKNHFLPQSQVRCHIRMVALPCYMSHFFASKYCCYFYFIF